MKKTTKFLLICTLFGGAFGSMINAESTPKGFVKSYEMSEASKYGKIHVDKEIKHSRHELKTASLPSSYSSVDEGYITSVKNQGEYGTCWAFAASAASEASLIKNNGFSTSTNLSELQFAYFNYTDAYDSLGLLNGDRNYVNDLQYGYLDIGGTNFFSMLGYAKWTGPVDEAKNTKYKYSNASSSFKPTSNADAYQLDEAHLKDCYIIDTSDIPLMKQMIMQYGAGDFAYNHYQEEKYPYDEPYYNESTYGYCYIQSKTPNDYNFQWSNHEVTVVGWDDNYAKTNFNSDSRPQNNGAWLVKNSWGSSWGDKGYFWLSYEDSAMLAEPATFYEYESNDNYLYNYQHDGTINYYSELASSNNGGYAGGGYMANVFTAQHNEMVQAVSFVTYEDNVDYTIEIYDGVTSTPISGTKVNDSTTSGTSTYAGYHSVSLTNPAMITEGNKFAVVVRLYDKNSSSTAITLACDETDSQSYIGFENDVADGQSYFSTNGSSWSDVSKSNKINFRIKAFTNEANVPLEGISFADTSLSLTEGDTQKLTPVFNPTNASNKSLTWVSSNPSVASVDTNGNVKALASGTTTITATSKENSALNASITINVKGITSISLSGTPNKTKYFGGDAFDPTGLTVNVAYSDSTNGTLALNDCTWLDGTTRLQTLSVGSTSVICKYGTHEATFNGIVVEQSQNFRLLTDISNLHEGDQIVIAQNSENVVAGNLSGKYLSPLDITLNSSKSEITTLPDSALKLTVGKSGNNYTFANASGQLLSANAAKNVGWNGSATTWKVTISDSNATIQSSTSSYGRIIYNVNSPRFTTYTSATNASMLLPQIYYKPGANLVDLTHTGTLAKTTYVDGEAFDPTGLTIKAIFDDNSEVDVTNKITWSALTMGSTSVIGTYTSAGVTKQITITGLTVNPQLATSLNASITNEIAIGETTQVSVNVLPSNTTNKEVSITTNDTNIVSINNNSVTGLSAGTARITVTTLDGSALTKELTILVYDPEVRESEARVNNVIAKIDAIGTITKDSKAKLDEAKNAYEALSTEEKARVTNYQELVTALQDYEDLIAARTQRIQEVITAIDNIGSVTKDSKETIDTAEALYNALANDEKAEVTNYNVLVAAKAAYEELTKPVVKPSVDTSASVSTGTSTSPSASTNTSTSTENPGKKGCHGSLVSTSILVGALALGGVFISLKKKKEDK